MRSIEATFDGQAFWPKEPVTLAPNTAVRLTIEPAKLNAPDSQASFLRTARALKLEGPADWSENLEDYLHGDKNHGA